MTSHAIISVDTDSVPLHSLKLPGSDPTLPPLVLLHGWGCNSDVWGDFVDLLQQVFFERSVWLVDLPGFGGSTELTDVTVNGVLDKLAEGLPEKSLLIGWSLGGMLATAFAARWPEKVEALVCLATNASYRQRVDWQPAVPLVNLQAFQESFSNDPDLCLKRFRANQALGDQQEKLLLRQLVRTGSRPGPGWAKMLELLDTLDNRVALENLTVDCLHLFGEQDTLVTAEAVTAINRLNPKIYTEIFSGVSHVLHLSQPDHVVQSIKNFLDNRERQRDKKQVAESFSRSAASYDEVAYLQRAVGNLLLDNSREYLASLPEDAWLLDLGCGTGHFLTELAAINRGVNRLGVDLAQGMIDFARNHHPGHFWSCGDAELMPIADQSIDLLFSNMTLQWCEDLPELASEIFRVLKPGGRAVFSTLGSGTLEELHTAWRQVDGEVHVNRFQTAGQWQKAFATQPFIRIDMHSEARITRYPDVMALGRELKALGAHNVNDGRHKQLTGKQRLRAFAEAYEPYREHDSGLLPATWQVTFLELHKGGE